MKCIVVILKFIAVCFADTWNFIIGVKNNKIEDYPNIV